MNTILATLLSRDVIWLSARCSFSVNGTQLSPLFFVVISCRCQGGIFIYVSEDSLLPWILLLPIPDCHYNLYY